eukprot:TRINITY_DN65358_c1_g1_i2.p1 TRINITY_DN65358_c1_g1~~TRINITY_DN65358_c1_g1_i2.p1  ORF type:complete len:330 (-),score=5.67 TRINITY_DN65358_c1_g1_i2:142-1032(-)
MHGIVFLFLLYVSSLAEDSRGAAMWGWAQRSRNTEEERYCKYSLGVGNEHYFVSEEKYSPLAEKIAQKMVTPIEMEFVAEDGTFEHYGGHLGFVRTNSCGTTTEQEDKCNAALSVLVYTALHNLVDPIDKLVSVKLLHVGTGKLHGINCVVYENEEVHELSEGTWPMRDIAVCTPPTVGSWEEKVFTKTTRPPQVGDAVGILVIRFRPLKQVDIGVPLQLLNVTATYGKERQPCLYTGTISRVTDTVIEYDINSFKGCSGAIVFYLEGPHQGEAVAVHTAGRVRSDGVPFTFGFRI